jgi:hypothetical protein
LHQSRVVDSAQETAGNGQPRLARTWTCYTIITHHRVTQLVRSSSRCSRVLLLPGLCLALTHTVMDQRRWWWRTLFWLLLLSWRTPEHGLFVGP